MQVNHRWALVAEQLHQLRQFLFPSCKRATCLFGNKVSESFNYLANHRYVVTYDAEYSSTLHLIVSVQTSNVNARIPPTIGYTSLSIYIRKPSRLAGGQRLHRFRRQWLPADPPLAASYFFDDYPRYRAHVLALDRNHGICQFLDHF